MADFKLDNGLRVVAEQTTGGRSVSIGIWIKQGSAHESPNLNGVSHLLEHLVFKGTKKRNAREIASCLESLGGNLDAYTTREYTCYSANVLETDVELALDVLADLALNPQLRAIDFELERKVVLEEMKGVNDTPDDHIFDEHAKGFWAGHSYGLPIMGTSETISSMSVENLRDFHRDRYCVNDMLIACSGNFDQDLLVKQTKDLFDAHPEGKSSAEVSCPTEAVSGQKHIQRDISQTHLVLANRVSDESAPDRDALIIACELFGGGMSSRLFQNIRETLGLAYTVFSFNSFYSRAGILGVYAATAPSSAENTLEEIVGEYQRMSRTDLTREEFERTKNQVKGRTMLSLQSTDDRLMRVADFALRDEPYESLDETLRRIDNVQLEEVQRVCQQFFKPEDLYIVRLGP